MITKNNGHTETPWKFGEMNITFFALGMRMAVGGTTDRQKAVLNGGKRAFKRSLFFVYI